MTDLHEFNWREGLDVWIAEVDAHLKEEDKPPEIAAQIAMVHLPRDVYACANRLRTQLEILTEAEWVWTWPMLKYALLSMQGGHLYKLLIEHTHADKFCSRSNRNL